MKTGKIILIVLFVVAIIGGIIAIKAKSFAVNQIEATIAKTKANNGTALTVASLGNAMVTGTASVQQPEWIDECFKYTGGTSSSAWTLSTNFTKTNCTAVTCGFPLNYLCMVRVFDPSLKYPDGSLKSDQDPIKSAIEDAMFFHQNETFDPDFHVYLKPLAI